MLLANTGKGDWNYTFNFNISIDFNTTTCEDSYQFVLQNDTCSLLQCSCAFGGVVCSNLSIAEENAAYITSQCPGAAICDSADWIVPKDCSCPSCPCNSTKDKTYSYTYNYYNVEKYCLEFTCTNNYWNLTNVSNQADVYSSFFDYFTCPAEYCSNDQLVGSITTNSTTSGCNICGCLASSGSESSAPTCYTSYSDLKNDAELLELFAEECYDVLAACWDDTSSWSKHCPSLLFDYFGTTVGCPTCTCSYSNTSTTSYYGSWAYDNSSFNCYACDCYPNNKTICEAIASDYGEFSCPPLACASNGVNNSEYCTSGDATSYCSYGYTFSSDNVTAMTSTSFSSGCESSWICEPLNGNEGCYTISDPITIYTVDTCYNMTLIKTEIEATTGYIKCCEKDNCNSALTLTRNTATCTNIAWADAYFTTLYECLYSEEALSYNGSLLAEILFCNLDYENLIGYDTCEYLEVLAIYYYGCNCKASSEVYTSGVSSTVKKGLLTDITYYNDSINALSSLLGCDLSWSCDLETGEFGVDFTEYYITFDITVSASVLTGNLTKDVAYIETYIAGVLGISVSDITVINYTGGTTIEIEITFSNYNTASTYQSDLSNNKYSSLSVSSVSGITSESSDKVSKNKSEGYFINLNYVHFIVMAFLLNFLL